MHKTTLLAAGLLACEADPTIIDIEEDRAGPSPGTNGGACIESPYNCKLRVSGGNAVATNDPHDDDSWAVDLNVPVRDGHGNVMAISTKTRVRFNYGQKRKFAGEDYAMARSTTNSSAGWMPLSAVAGEASLRDKLGHVSARGSGLDEMGCYEIRDAHDEALVEKKVVYDTTSSHDRAGDYLPLPRANGLRSANLAYSVPGFGLGAPAIDHFPAGTKFRRLDVPTDDGPPSIDIPLWVADASGRYRKQSGTMKFIYGYVIAATGTKRNGWMAYDALRVSDGCDGEEPEPEPEPEPPTSGQCYARCCDDMLAGPSLVADANACYDAAQSMCESHDHVRRVELDGAEVWERSDKCWAKCNGRLAYHVIDGVTEGCAERAAAWCDEGDRGGLEDAMWSRCEP